MVVSHVSSRPGSLPLPLGLPDCQQSLFMCPLRVHNGNTPCLHWHSWCHFLRPFELLPLTSTAPTSASWARAPTICGAHRTLITSARKSFQSVRRSELSSTCGFTVNSYSVCNTTRHSSRPSPFLGTPAHTPEKSTFQTQQHIRKRVSTRGSQWRHSDRHAVRTAFTTRSSAARG